MGKSIWIIIIGMMLLIVLASTSLLYTYLIYNKVCQMNPSRQLIDSDRILPDVIKLAKEKISKKLIEDWNDKDVMQLYSMLGHVAKEQIAFQEFKKQTDNLLLLGQISDSYYFGFRYEGKYQGYDAYDIIYSITIDNKSGRLTISIIDLDGDCEVLGFNLSKDY